jgi:hypothetical protein
MVVAQPNPPRQRCCAHQGVEGTATLCAVPGARTEDNTVITYDGRSAFIKETSASVQYDYALR